jgi:hypothetical protein
VERDDSRGVVEKVVSYILRVSFGLGRRRATVTAVRLTDGAQALRLNRV